MITLSPIASLWNKLAEDLTEHIHIENNILFPKFEA
jgi:iron-sulfur cluster repair protein YtfE (RIC family)